MLFELRIEIVKKFRTQINAAREMKIGESRLSHIIRGHHTPSARERRALEKALGSNRVCKILNEPRAEDQRI